MAPTEQPKPTLFDAFFALLSFVLVFFSMASSFLLVFISIGVFFGLDGQRWIDLAPTFLVLAVLPFVLDPAYRTLAASPLSILARLRPWEQGHATNARLARLCTTTYWILLATAACAPEHLFTTPFLALHAAHLAGWPSSFWMAVVHPGHTPAPKAG